jgi:hypothetical protein
MTQKNFCLKKSKQISNNSEFHADFETVEKVVKNSQKKLQAKQV